MLKMGDKSLAFVGKTIQYAKDFPKVIPEIIDIEKLQCEYDKAQELEIVVRKMETILASVKDTRMVAAEHAYMLSLKVYQAFKVANNLDVPGISAIIEDLGKRFNNRTTSRKSTQDPFPEVRNQNRSFRHTRRDTDMVQDQVQDVGYNRNEE